MDLRELVALAKARSGKNQQVMAEEMGHKGHTRITKIAKGLLEPSASEIVYLAETANEPPLKILAEIESQRNPALAYVWAAKGIQAASL